MRSLVTTLKAAIRLVPALFGILIVLFITSDAWKTFGLEPAWRFTALLVFIAMISIAAAIVGMRDSGGDWRHAIGYPEGGSEFLASWARQTPAWPLVGHVLPLLPLYRQEGRSDSKYSNFIEYNISALYVITIVVHLIAVACWIAFTFVFVEVIALAGPMTKNLIGKTGNVVVGFSVYGQQFMITSQLIFVSIILGGIAALTFAAVTLQDKTGRQAFL